MQQEWETMDFDQFVEWATGHLVIAIGKGDFRSEVYGMLNLAHQRGYANGRKALLEEQAEKKNGKGGAP